MGSLVSELEKLVKDEAFSRAIVIPIGTKSVSIPPPKPTDDTPTVLRSQAIFPNGDPDVADFAKTLDLLDFAGLPAPLNAIGKVTLEGLEIDFISNGFYPTGFRAKFGYPGAKIGFQKTNISDIHLTCDCVMPVDPALASTTIYAQAKIEIEKVPTHVEIDSRGCATFLLNDGKPIAISSIEELAANAGFSLELPVPAAKFSSAQVVLDTKSKSISVSADFESATLKFFCCELSLDRLLVELGEINSASLVLSGEIGSLTFVGLINVPGAIIVSASIPAIHIAKLIGDAIPDLKSATKPLEGVKLPTATITLSKTDETESLALSTAYEPSDLVPDAVEKFMDHVGIGVPQVEVTTELLLIPNPRTARFRLAMMSGQPVRLVAKSNFAIQSLWLEIDVAEANAAFGLGIDVAFPFHDQSFEFTGSVLAEANEVTVQARQKLPAVWKNPLGIQGLDLSQLNLELGISYEGLPTIGIGGDFSVKIPDSGSTFTGKVEFLFDAGNPALSVFQVQFKYIDLSEFFDLFFPGHSKSPIHKLLQQFRFSDCGLYFAPEGCSIAGVPYPQGFSVHGAASFFGWKNELKVEVDPTQGIDFDCHMDSSIHIAQIFELYDPDHPAKGPAFTFSTHPEAGDPILKITGAIEIAGVLNDKTDVLFDETQFHIDLTARLFQTAGVRITTSAAFAHIASSSLEVTLELTGIEDLERKINSTLRADAKAAAKTISKLEAKVESAERELKPLLAKCRKLQDQLKGLIAHRDHAHWYEKPYWEAQILWVQGEIATAEGFYKTARDLLQAAVDALEDAKTVENCALYAIAGFIDHSPILLKSVRSSIAASALHNSKFSLDVELSVNSKGESFRMEADFNVANMVEKLDADIRSAIVKLFQ